MAMAGDVTLEITTEGTEKMPDRIWRPITRATPFRLARDLGTIGRLPPPGPGRSKAAMEPLTSKEPNGDVAADAVM